VCSSDLAKNPRDPKRNPKALNSIQLLPLGGLGEIGLNCMAIIYRESILVIDAGLMFPDPSQPGVDLVVPDFSFLRENISKIQGVIFTHGHEDHIGALQFLLKSKPDLPLYGTKLTMSLAKNRLGRTERDLINSNVIKAGDKLQLGHFKLEFISVNHSILDSLGVAITTPAGVLIHTGDFKMDAKAPLDERLDLAKFAQYGNKGVLALLSDSTNADKSGYSISEREVGASLVDIFQKASGRIILACFASSLARIREVIEAATKSRRRLVFNGRSMEANIKLAVELKYLYLEPNLTVKISEANTLAPERVCIVLTGSQGEPLSALSRMASGDHKDLNVEAGDTIIFSASAIPGNETAINKLINIFLERGANVVDKRHHRVHASGHGSQEELKLMISLTKPHFLIPVHGEYKHLLAHARLGVEQGLVDGRAVILKNGQRLILTKDKECVLGSPVPTGRALVDGNRLGSSVDPVIKTRRAMSEMGMAVLTVVLDPVSRELLNSPQIIVSGVLYEGEEELALHFERKLSEFVKRGIKGKNPELPLYKLKSNLDFKELLESLLKRELRHLFKESIGRKPLVIPQVIFVAKGNEYESSL
jgi:ribonuclease J